MKLPEICIRQPVLAVVMSLVLMVLGVIGYLHLEKLFFPRLQIPVVHVSTHYDGASASLMESKITTPTTMSTNTMNPLTRSSKTMLKCLAFLTSLNHNIKQLSKLRILSSST